MCDEALEQRRIWELTWLEVRNHWKSSPLYSTHLSTHTLSPYPSWFLEIFIFDSLKILVYPGTFLLLWLVFSVSFFSACPLNVAFYSFPEGPHPLVCFQLPPFCRASNTFPRWQLPFPPAYKINTAQFWSDDYHNVLLESCNSMGNLFWGDVTNPHHFINYLNLFTWICHRAKGNESWWGRPGRWSWVLTAGPPSVQWKQLTDFALLLSPDI